MDLKLALEALLFREGRELRFAELAKTLNLEEAIVREAAAELAADYQDRGISVVQTEDAVGFATSRTYSRLIDTIYQEEQKGELTPAALDTLSIVLYYSPVSKADIDYIRGVNSGAMLRTLSVRDLIERKSSKQGGHRYYPSITLLRHLGLARVSELPNYEEVRSELTTFLEKKV